MSSVIIFKKIKLIKNFTSNYNDGKNYQCSERMKFMNAPYFVNMNDVNIFKEFERLSGHSN